MKNPSLQNKKIKCLVCGTEYDLSKQHCPKCKYPALFLTRKIGQKPIMIEAAKADFKKQCQQKKTQQKKDTHNNQKPANNNNNSSSSESGCGSGCLIIALVLIGIVIYNLFIARPV